MLKETGSGFVQVDKYDNLWNQAFNLQICKSVWELTEKTKTRKGSSFPSFKNEVLVRHPVQSKNNH